MNSPRLTRHGHEQWTLGRMIDALEQIARSDPDQISRQVRFDFYRLYPRFLGSWRGSYSEMGISFGDGRYDEIPRLDRFLTLCRAAVGSLAPGWKGGEYEMTRDTPLWVAQPEDSGNTAVVGVRVTDHNGIIIDTDWCDF